MPPLSLAPLQCACGAVHLTGSADSQLTLLSPPPLGPRHGTDRRPPLALCPHRPRHLCVDALGPRSPEITRDHPDTVHGLLASTHSIQERARWPEDGPRLPESRSPRRRATSCTRRSAPSRRSTSARSTTRPPSPRRLAPRGYAPARVGVESGPIFGMKAAGGLSYLGWLRRRRARADPPRRLVRRRSAGVRRVKRARRRTTCRARAARSWPMA